MLLHQGLGLDAFNELSPRKAVHALYECCGSVVLAGDLAGGRPYESRDELFRRADALLFALSESSVDTILQGYLPIEWRTETERKVVRNELARINRTRLERMLGPEGGYHNW